MSVEKRYPRERFTRSLQRICKRLADGPTSREIDVRFMKRRFGKTEVQALSLWVVGSYARGAHTCGDLDLVLHVVAIDGRMPSDVQIAKAFVGVAPGVLAYVGRPEENSSGVSFPEARLVWSLEQPDWRELLGEIPVCATAGRFVRPSDILPLARRQFHCDDDRVESLLMERSAGVIDWTFVPLDPYTASTPGLSEYLAEQIGRRSNLGKKTRQVLEHYLAAVPAWADEKLRGDSREGFSIAGTSIRIGTPQIPDAFLDSLDIVEEAFIPHFSTRGPNGAWVIRRGPKHPLVLRAQRRRAFALAFDGMPPDIRVFDEYGYETRLLELYQTAELAKKDAESMDFDGDGDPIGVVSLVGDSLLEAIGRADELVVFPEQGEPRSIEVRRFERWRSDSDALHDEFFGLLAQY